MMTDQLRKYCAAILTAFFIPPFAGVLAVQAQEPTSKLEIVPPNPKAYQPVILQVPRYGDWVKSIKMKGNRISVILDGNVVVPLLPPMPPVDAYLGQLPAGDYEVEVSIWGQPLGVKSFTVSELSELETRRAAGNIFNDLWWNPAESGWGMNLTAKNGILFAAWYVYDETGHPAWLTIQGFEWVNQWPEMRCYQGTIWRTSGPPLGGILGLDKVGLNAVGKGRFCMSDDNQSIQFSYTVDGISNQKTLYRQPF